MSEEPLLHHANPHPGGGFGSNRNVVGFALMIAGTLCFAIFHFLEDEHMQGWEIWKGLVDFVESGDFLRSRDGLLGYSCFVTLALLTTSSPCLISWLIRSLWLKWCLAGFSAMAAGIMWYFTAVEGPDSFILPLAVTPSLTLAGLLCIRTVPRTLRLPGGG